MQKELRKNQDTLIVTGLGVIFFAFWNIVKTVMFLLLCQDKIKDLTEPLLSMYSLPEQKLFFNVIFYSLITIAEIISFCFTMYIGLSARAEGMGGSRSCIYLVLSFFLVFFNLGLIYYNILFFDIHFEYLSDEIMAIIFELSSFFTLLQMIISAIKVKIIRHKLARRSSHAN